MAADASVAAAQLAVAGSIVNAAAIPFNTMNNVAANQTAAANAAASAAALESERSNVLRVFDRESTQLNADQTLAFIMSGLEAGTGGTVENVQGITKTERAADRSHIWGQYQTNIDNARRQEAAAKKGARNSLIGGIVQAGTTVGALAIFSDERLKEQLIAVGKSRTGLTIYLGRYKKESGLYDGKLHLFILAQDVQKIRPSAVKVGKNGFLMVDYAAALIGE